LNGLVSHELLKDAISALLRYCQKENWAGYDPYDGLNSRVFSSIPILQNKFGKLSFIQLMKRSPVNLRRLMLVPKSHNPKGLALFASALMKLHDVGLVDSKDAALSPLGMMIKLRDPKNSYYSWGYNFDWQSRLSFTPKGVPNIICTTFSGNALLDAYERYGDLRYLEMAGSAGRFLLDGLNISREGEGLCFSYTPLDRGRVHNANLLGAAYLARLHRLTGEKRFHQHALSAAWYSAGRQNPDGSWFYGEGETQKWVDNFHTGYNLIALKNLCRYAGTDEFRSNISRGHEYYKKNFFTDEGIPKYYHNEIYPIDIHSISQSIVTLVEFREYSEDNLTLALRVCRWAFENMRSPEGFFYFQKTRYFKNTIPYMRWSQGWMLYGLATLASVMFTNPEYCEARASGDL
jgi:hypothetical protein